MLELKPSTIDLLVNDHETNLSREDIYNFLMHLESSMSQPISGFMLLVCVFYALLFCVGIIGNFWVMSVIGRILRTIKNRTIKTNLFLYVFTLSCVDSLVLLSLPMLIISLASMRWFFGRALCKVYWIVESYNKILSIFILTAMSFDRFLTMCHPTFAPVLRESKGTLIVLVSLLFFVSILLIPVYIYADEIVHEDIVTISNMTFRFDVPGCTFVLPPDLLSFFTNYIFIFGFCIPSVLIVYFYARVLYYIYSHAFSFQMHQSHIPLKRVTFLTLSIIIFFLICWTPYWASVMYTHVRKLDTDQEPYLFLLLHALVYVNSSFNWIFYAFLNNNLRECRELASEHNQLLNSSRMPLRRSLSTRYYSSTPPSTTSQNFRRKRFATVSTPSTTSAL